MDTLADTTIVYVGDYEPVLCGMRGRDESRASFHNRMVIRAIRQLTQQIKNPTEGGGDGSMENEATPDAQPEG